MSPMNVTAAYPPTIIDYQVRPHVHARKVYYRTENPATSKRAILAAYSLDKDAVSMVKK